MLSYVIIIPIITIIGVINHLLSLLFLPLLLIPLFIIVKY